MLNITEDFKTFVLDDNSTWQEKKYVLLKRFWSSPEFRYDPFYYFTNLAATTGPQENF